LDTKFSNSTTKSSLTDEPDLRPPSSEGRQARLCRLGTQKPTLEETLPLRYEVKLERSTETLAIQAMEPAGASSHLYRVAEQEEAKCDATRRYSKHSTCDLHHYGGRQYDVYLNTLTMGRLSKVALLAVLLTFAGYPGATSLFCAQPSGLHGHACCVANEQSKASHRATSSLAVSGAASCCKVAPIESTPIQPIQLSGASHDRVNVLQAAPDIAGTLPASALLLRRGSSPLTKLRHSPVHAFLCTFLV